MRGRIRGSRGKTHYEIFQGGSRGWVEVSQAEFEAAFPDKPIVAGDDLRTSTEWREPIVSDAIAVLPNQAAEAAREAAKHGVPTEFREGKPVFTSREHRRKYMRSVGVHDRRGGYGD